MTASTSAPRWQTLLAFGIIYFVWGSTFLAIRIGVGEVPPYLFASMRFSVAGLVLVGWTMARGERLPTLHQWGAVVSLALLIFVLDYGSLFWAEQRVPSGVAAVMLATIPMFMALSEIVLLRTQRLTLPLAAALVIGVGGVAVLMSRSLNLGGIGRSACCSGPYLRSPDLVDCRRAHPQVAVTGLQDDELRCTDASGACAAGRDCSRSRGAA